MPLFRPGKPHIRLQLAADVPLVNGVSIVWSSAAISEGWPWPVTTADVINCPRAGLYIVGWYYATGVPNVNTLIGMKTFLNGVQTGPRHRPGTSTNAPRGGSGQVLYQLAEGDTIACNPDVSSGATVSLQAAHCGLYAVRVGPERWTG